MISNRSERYAREVWWYTPLTPLFNSSIQARLSDTRPELQWGSVVPPTYWSHGLCYNECLCLTGLPPPLLAGVSSSLLSDLGHLPHLIVGLFTCLTIRMRLEFVRSSSYHPDRGRGTKHPRSVSWCQYQDGGENIWSLIEDLELKVVTAGVYCYANTTIFT